MTDWTGSPRSLTALLIGEPGPSTVDADAAVRAAGGEVAGRIGWAEAVALDPPAGRPLLLVEAEGADLDRLAAALPSIGQVAAALGLPVIVALDHAQIDLVFATLAAAGVQFLCQPTRAERVAAIAIAANAAPIGVREGGGQSEAERFDRLNAEVARIAAVLARLTGSDTRGPDPSGVGDRRLGFATAPATAEPVAAADLRRTIRARRLRDQFLGDGLFEDPAWDILLDLFAAELEGAQVSVSSLCIAAAVAPTTALRWIGRLTEAGLLERQPDPGDRRRAFMALSAHARSGLLEYFRAVRAGGLPI